MDIALVVEQLVPGAEYFGSVTEGTKAAWDAVVWKDTRSKPNWGNIQSTWNSLNKSVKTPDISQSIQAITQQLTMVDMASVRSIRAILRGNPLPEEQVWLEKHGQQAETLREKLREISK